MLIVRRQLGQAIKIGDGVVARILQIGPRTVVIGIEAPADVPIRREEAASVPRVVPLKAEASGGCDP